MDNYKTPRIKDYNGDLTKRWYIQYAFKDPDTGKFQEFREWISSSHKSKTARYVAAKALCEGIKIKLIQGFNPFFIKEVRKPILQALNEIITIKATVLRKRTVHSYSSIAGLFGTWLTKHQYGRLMPHQLNKHVVQCYFDDCLLIEKVVPRTFNNRLRTLRTLFNELIARDYLEFNVFTKIKLLPEPESQLEAYTSDEKNLIKNLISESFPELWLCAMFVYYTFIRPQELCRLNFSDLDFTNRLVHIPGIKSKNKKTQTVLIPDPLYDLLIKMSYHKLPGWLLIFSNDRHLTPGSIEISPTRIFNSWQENVINKTGINKGIYLFKHTGVGELFENGADARNVQLQLRHHSLEEVVVYAAKYSNAPNENLRAFFKEI